MLHSRTDTEQDDIALRCLPGCEYKAYRYLVNRADTIGVCYPKIPTIADAIGCSAREAQRALEVLNDNDVFRYRRKNAFNPVTRRKETNVYQINPLILVIADEFVSEAWSEWDALINQCGNVSTGLWSHINQHQEPIPRTNSRTNSRTSTTKSPAKADGQGGPPDDYANAPTGGKKPKPKNPDGESTQRAAPDQRGHAPKSSVPPGDRPQYANPTLINTNLPNQEHEMLASQIRKFGIGMGLARGFVVEYGYERTKLAFDQVEKMGDKAREPAAVFRSIVQVRLVGDFAQAHEQVFKSRKQS